MATTQNIKEAFHKLEKLLKQMTDPLSETFKKRQANEVFQQLITGGMIQQLIKHAQAQIAVYQAAIKEFIANESAETRNSHKPHVPTSLATETAENTENLAPSKPLYDTKDAAKDAVEMANLTKLMQDLTKQYQAYTDQMSANTQALTSNIVQTLGTPSLTYTNHQGVQQTITINKENVNNVQNFVAANLNLTGQQPTTSLANPQAQIRMQAAMQQGFGMIQPSTTSNGVEITSLLLPSQMKKLQPIEQQVFKSTTEQVKTEKQRDQVVSKLADTAQKYGALQQKMQQNQDKLTTVSKNNQTTSTTWKPPSPVSIKPTPFKE